MLSLTAISVDSALSLTALSEFAIVCKILRRPRGIKLSQQFRPKNILAQYVLIFRLKHFHCNFCSKLIFLKLNCSNLHHIRILEFLQIRLLNPYTNTKLFTLLLSNFLCQCLYQHNIYFCIHYTLYSTYVL